MKSKITNSVAVAMIAGLTLTGSIGIAGGDRVSFPESDALGVSYGSLDRADNKQYREFFASRSVIAAIKSGGPAPNGAVITMMTFKAKLDPLGNPEKDVNGRFIKDSLVGYFVMEKRSGWGSEYPDALRNGEWEYQAFTSAKAVNAAAKLENCFTCHKPQEKADFMFTQGFMKSAP